MIKIIVLTGFTMKCSFTRTTHMHVAKLKSKLRLKGVLVKEVKLQRVHKKERYKSLALTKNRRTPKHKQLSKSVKRKAQKP